MRFLAILLYVFFAGLIAISLQRLFQWPAWSYFALCTALGLTLYFANMILIKTYIERNAPGIAMIDRLHPGANEWERTAGRGVVPRWVSHIGLLGVGFFLAMPFELLARFFR